MSLIFVHSFDAGDSGLGKFTAGISSPTINTTNARFTGANAWQVANPNIGGAETFRLTIPAGMDDDVIVVGIAIRYEGTLSGEGVGGKALLALSADGGTTTHTTLGVAADGSIGVRRGTASGTQIALSSAGAIVLNTWHYLELKVKLHDTTGTVDVHVDGASVISSTGLDTKNGGTDTLFDQVEFGGGGVGATTRMRDIYLLNEQGSVNNNFLGDVRVHALFPTSDSTPEEWDRSTGSDTFALIDETTPNGDTDYIESDVAAEVARVGMGDLSDTTHVVFGVQTTIYAKKDDAGSRSVRAAVVSDGNVENGADHVLGTSYATYRDVFELDPDGDIPWTPTTVNAVLTQVEVRA